MTKPRETKPIVEIPPDLYGGCCCCCLRSVTALFPRGRLPKEDLRRSPLPPRPLVTPGPYLPLCSLSPHTIVMHPASGQYPPCNPRPVHISYLVFGLFLPCLLVLHIYSTPQKENPSTKLKPHTQTVLIYYFNNRTINSKAPLRLSSCVLRAYLFRCLSLTPSTLFPFTV